MCVHSISVSSPRKTKPFCWCRTNSTFSPQQVAVSLQKYVVVAKDDSLRAVQVRIFDLVELVENLPSTCICKGWLIVGLSSAATPASLPRLIRLSGPSIFGRLHARPCKSACKYNNMLIDLIICRKHVESKYIKYIHTYICIYVYIYIYVCTHPIAIASREDICRLLLIAIGS